MKARTKKRGMILGGARAAELPVPRPEASELVVQVRTARALGLPTPQSVLLRATGLIAGEACRVGCGPGGRS